MRRTAAIAVAAHLSIACGGQLGGDAQPNSGDPATSAGGQGGAGQVSAAQGGTTGQGGTNAHAATTGQGGASGESGTTGQGGNATNASTGSGGTSPGQQTERPLGSVSGAPNGYYEYLPGGYDGSSPAPLLVFWHGLGQDGNGTTDLPNVLAFGVPKIIANGNWDSARPFIVLSPQYNAVSGEIAPGGGCPSSSVIHDFLAWATSHYNVDAKRVYLTGLSCGAIGSWDYLANYQGSLVAAAVLMSGNPGDPAAMGSTWGRAGCSLGSAAIWSLHGDADDTVPYAPDEATLKKLVACPSPPRRDAVFTDVVGGGHLIWDPIYDLSGGYGDIYTWMLAQAKP